METGNEPFNDRARDELKRAYARKDLRREESRAYWLTKTLYHHKPRKLNRFR